MRWSNVLTAVAATWASTAAAQDVTASGIGSVFGCGFWIHANLTELASKLSANADIYLPGSTEFTSLSQRWSELEIPQVNVTVAPATENDVVQTVKWAYKYGIPFLAFNGVHGSITTLGRMDCGINISVEKLSGAPSSAGVTAKILGGTMSKTITVTLWAANKQTVMGACECVSYLGPALVGDHGWLQGYYVLTIDQPVIAFYIIQEGTSVSSQYTQPFYDIGPISVTPLSGDCRDLAGWTGVNLAGEPCKKIGLANPRFPVYLPKYNPTAQQQIYNIFAAATNSSSPFSNSLFIFEGYSTQGVKAVASSSTAFAYRADNLLIAPLIQYTPAGPARDAAAKHLGNQLRNALNQGAGYIETHSYVNYDYGDQSPKGWYGSAPFRQIKLKLLKLKYDPLGRFSFFGPISPW